jgi:hypothetical protein
LIFHGSLHSVNSFIPWTRQAKIHLYFVIYQDKTEVCWLASDFSDKTNFRPKMSIPLQLFKNTQMTCDQEGIFVVEKNFNYPQHWLQTSMSHIFAGQGAEKCYK